MFDKIKAKDVAKVYMEKYSHLLRLSKLSDIPERIAAEDLFVKSLLNIYIEPTNRCNLNCEFCARENMQRSYDMLDFEVFKNLIDSLPRGTYLTLTGNGEPTINVSIYNMIKYASDAGMITSIITNACALNDENRKKLLGSGISRIQMSFQSIDKNTNEALMIGSDFNRQLLNILKMIKEIREGNRNIYISISSVKTDLGKPFSDITREFWKKIPIDNYYEGELLSLQNDSKMFVKKNEKIKYHPCAIPWIGAKINANGDVSGCHQDFSNKYVLGNIKDNNLLDILNSQIALKYRKAILTGDWEYLDSIGYGCCRYCNTWQEKVNYNIKGAVEEYIPLRLGLVINEISEHGNNKTEFLNKVIESIEKEPKYNIIEMMESQ